MAINVTVQVLGGNKKNFDSVASLDAILTAMDLPNASIKINGNTAESGDTLPDYAFVSLGEKVKGGNA